MSKAKPGNSSNPFTLFHLQAEHSGWTLARTLKELNPGSSWNEVKRWIAKRHVQINGNLCLDEARRVTERDVVKLWKQPLEKPVESRDVRIAYLDEHLMVVEKPAGVTSVRHVQERTLSTRRRQLQPTLEELLPPVLARMQHLRWPPLPPLGQNRGKRKPGKPGSNKRDLPIQNAKKLPPELQVLPVHRLDRDTSGLMLFARNRLAEQRLLAMFRRHSIEREYVGVCLGSVQPQTFRSWLVRDRGDGIRGSLPANHGLTDEELQTQAALATTHVISGEPIAGGAYTLFRCKLETGRTHQIRIHFSEAGHMLCGDKIYNTTASGERIADTSGAPRHALHSDRIGFTHPCTGEHLQFEMPLPHDLARWLTQLRNSGA